MLSETTFSQLSDDARGTVVFLMWHMFKQRVCHTREQVRVAQYKAAASVLEY